MSLFFISKNMEDDLIKGLEAAGLQPLVIDENTVFPLMVKEGEEEFLIQADSKGRAKTNSNRNRTAGNNWEREIVNDLKSIGYTQATTSRNASKVRDNEKVDIMNLNERQDGFLPFDIQAKNLSAVSGFDAFLREMKDNVNTVRVILLRKTTKAVKRFMTQGDFAIMYYKDWLYYVETEKKYKELQKQYDTLKNMWDGTVKALASKNEH